MSSIFYFAQSSTSHTQSHSELQSELYERFRKVSDQIKKEGVRLPECLRYLTRVGIAECVVGVSHLAFRLDDGRVCRVSYVVNAERLSTKPEKKKSSNRNADSSSRETGGGGGGGGGGGRSSNTYTICPQRSIRGASTLLTRNTRSLNFLREMHRQGVYLTRPLAPSIQANQVPEELIEQCQAVLQGKSRQLIVRELQRTNLDVNMAVNNLLSRDDEGDEGDEWEDETEDLLSLLDQGESIFDPENVLSEDLFTSAPLRRSEMEYSLNERRKRRRLENAVAYQPHIRNPLSDPLYRSGAAGSDSTGRHGEKSETANQRSDTAQDDTNQAIQLGTKLEFWCERCHGPELRFVSLACLFSELVGLSISGELHQWRWADSEPYAPPVTCMPPNQQDTWSNPEPPSTSSPPPPPHHPRAAALGLVGERIVLLSGCTTRASVLTRSGRVATWMDESLAPVAGRLEQTAVRPSELAHERVVNLYTAPLVTVAHCASGALYWWGVMPHYLRKKITEKARQKSAVVKPPPSADVPPPSGPPPAPTPTTGGTWRGGGLQRGSTAAPGASTTPVGTGPTPPGPPTSSASATPAPPTSTCSSSGGLVLPGAFVCMKNAPIFHAGAIGFTVVDGVPKVGTLLEDAWRLTDVCRFRVKSATLLASERRPSPTTDSVHQCAYATALQQQQANPSLMYGLLGSSLAASTPGSVGSGVSAGDLSALDSGRPEMPPPPSPASSTCSDQSGPVRVSPGSFKRKKQANSRERDTGPEASSSSSSSAPTRGRTQPPVSERERGESWPSGSGGVKRAGTPSSGDTSSPVEQDWYLSDVIFLEDGRTQPVGCVLKVDGNIAAVKFLKDSERACLAAGCPMVPLSAIIGGAAGALGTSDLSTGLPPSSTPPGMSDPISWLHDCRLLRKDELTVVKNAGSPRVPDFVQRYPKKIVCFSPGNLLLQSAPGPVPPPYPSGGVIPPPGGTLAEQNDVGILAVAIENSQVHLILRPPNNSARLEYQVYSLQGKVVSRHRFTASAKDFVGKSSRNVSLTNAGARPFLLRDGNGTVYPFLPPVRTTQDTLPNPHWLDLPCIRASGLAVTCVGRQRVIIGVLALEEQLITHHILRADASKVMNTLYTVNREDAALSTRLMRTLLAERCDGQRNILHTAVSMCVPLSNKEADWALESSLTQGVTSPPVRSSGGSTPSVPPPSYKASTEAHRTVHDTFIRRSSTSYQQLQLFMPLSVGPTSSSHQQTTAQTTTASSSPVFHYRLERDTTGQGPEDLSTTSGFSSGGITRSMSEANLSTMVSTSDYFWYLPPVRLEEKERRLASYQVVQFLVENSLPESHLVYLLSSRNAEGHTPFMQAVSNRVYVVANYLFDKIQEISAMIGRATGGDTEAGQSAAQRQALLSMIFPTSSNLDDSPLQMLCYNDTCSFTWTGPDHIRQDIFECRTCGLMDTLCCCTECARVCHKGHDCRLKRTSPTAYCDCWEKCRCASLVAGAQGPRHDLLMKLLNNTDLATLPNRRGEHLLLFLVKTVDRQTREQKSHVGSRSRPRSHHLRSLASADTGDMPEHSLDPPKFTGKALEAVLANWSAVETLLNAGVKDTKEEKSSLGASLRNWEEEQVYLQYQSGVTHLDQFVFCLVAKCSPDLTDCLLRTLNREMSRPSAISGHTDRAKRAAGRLVRSVARVYTAISLELPPDANKKKNSRSNLNVHQPLEVCRTVFYSLLSVALVELPQLADRLSTPMRLGIVRPTAPFNPSNQMADVITGCEDLFLSDSLTSRLGGGLGDRYISESSDYDRPLSPSGGEGGGRGEDTGDDMDRHGDAETSGTREMTGGQDDEDIQSGNELDTDIEMEMDGDDDDSDNDEVDMGLLHDSTSDSDSVGSADIDTGLVGEASGQAARAGPPQGSESGHDRTSQGSAEQDARSTAAEVGSAVGDGGDTSSEVGAVVTTSGPTSSQATSGRPRPANSSVRSGVRRLGYFSGDYSDRSDEDDISEHTDDEDLSNESNDMNAIEIEDLSSSNLYRTRFLSTSGQYFPSVLARSSVAGGAAGGGVSSSRYFAPVPAPSVTTPAWMTWALRQSGSTGRTAPPSTPQTATTGSSASGGGGTAASLSGAASSSGVSSGTPGVPAGGTPVEGGGTQGTPQSGSLETAVLRPGITIGSVHNYLQSGRRNAIAGLHLASSAAHLPLVPDARECGMQLTQIRLSRALACLLRLIGDLIVYMRQPDQAPLLSASRHRAASSRLPPVSLSSAEMNGLESVTGHTLTPIWLWLCSAMDSIEAQLRFGSALNKVSGVVAPTIPSTGSTLAGTSESNRSEYLNYMLSLMRSASDEHADSLPVVDLLSYRHVAYSLDAFLYLARWWDSGLLTAPAPLLRPPAVPEGNPEDRYTWAEQDDMDEDQDDGSSLRPTIGSECGDSVADEETVTSNAPTASSQIPSASASGLTWTRREDAFFRRSESTLSLAGLGLDPVSTSVSEALPLSVKPHLLHPSSRREDLFGTASHFPEDVDMPRLRSQRNDSLPIHLSMTSTWGTSMAAAKCQESSPNLLERISPPSQLLSRWHVALEMFGRLFADDVGAEPRSIILELGGFPVKESRFRKEMERFRNSTRRDLTLEVERERGALIISTMRQLSLDYMKRYTTPGSPPALSCHRIKVTFRDEPGEGSGVARSFFTAFSEAILSQDKFPNLDNLHPQSSYQRYNQMSRSTRRNFTEATSAGSTSSASRSSTLTTSTSRPSSAGTYTLLHTINQRLRQSAPSTTPVSSAAPSSTSYGGPSSVSWQRLGGLSIRGQPYHSIYDPHGLVPLGTPSSTTESTTTGSSTVSASVASTTTSVSGLSSSTFLVSGSTPGGSSGPGAGFWTQKRHQTERMLHRVQRYIPEEARAAKVTSMLLEMPVGVQLMLQTNEEELRAQVEDVRSIIEEQEGRDPGSEPTSSAITPVRETRLLDSILSSNETLTSADMVRISSAPPRPLVSSTALELALMDDATSQPPPAPLPLDPENAPLFWQPGILGYYAPRAVLLKDSAKEASRNCAYRNVGRVVGLCLLMNETCPLTFCRHVFKYIIGRPVNWHDLAFFDSTMYEGLRQLLSCTLADDGGVAEITDFGLSFVVERTSSEGSGPAPLIEGGESVDVTAENVFEYVKRYAQYRLIEVVKEPLEQLRKGVFDVIPRHSLEGLTAEDLRLLLNGTGEIDVDVLTSYTTFHDESGVGQGNERVAKFKKWFWHTFRQMNHRQRQDLLYFWTSSPALPASEQGFQPMPSITIRPVDDCHLPTANTCISRLYIPLYSSRHILKEKLLQAIQTKGFGFV